MATRIFDIADRNGANQPPRAIPFPVLAITEQSQAVWQSAVGFSAISQITYKRQKLAIRAGNFQRSTFNFRLTGGNRGHGEIAAKRRRKRKKGLPFNHG